jgi:branched-chain amino acid transport system substrate-binding protein
VIAYNELASDDSVVAILSSSSVTNSAATGPAAERAEIPTIALSPVNAFADGSNKWVFTVPAGAGLSAAELASYAKASGFKTVAIAHSQDAYGDAGLATTTGALKKVGVDVVMEESYDATATDFTALLTHVKQAAPDALIVWGAGAGPVIITKQFAGMGINAQLIMTGAQASSLYVDPAGDAAEGVVMSSSISVPGEELPASPLKDAIDKFVTPFEAANGGAYPAQFGFDGAAGVQLIQAAIEKAGSVDRSAIRDSLDTLKVLTSNGTYSYSADNHMGLTPAAVTMVVVKGGKLVATDYAKSTFADKTK